MDKPIYNLGTPAIRLVEKPKSTWTGLLNGAGNGAMVGGAGLVAYNVWEHFKKPGTTTPGKPNPFFIAATAATAIGTAIGAVYGYNEAKQLNTYRNALARDIETLHAQIDGMDPKISR